MNYEHIIKENAEQYYTTGNQKLSDDVFDAVVDKVRKENPNSDVLDVGWGYKPDDENKVMHKYCKVGSLNKLRTYKDIVNAFGENENIADKSFHVSAKLDGMSVILYYKYGKLTKAITRGDGEFGVDITSKVSHIKGIKLELKDYTFSGAVRGEIFMTPSQFKDYKQEHPEAKNHRNSAIGIINSDSITDDYKYLSLYVYTVVASENTKYFDGLIYDHYDWLKFNFDCVVPYQYILGLSENDYYDKLESLRNEFSKIVNIDGVVITSTFIDYENNHYKYHQFAFKFQDEIEITTVKHIEWNISKHGAYIPVVCIETVMLEGTAVSRVSGYNAKWIKDMNIHAGSVVAVRKANQIIPQIVQVIQD